MHSFSVFFIAKILLYTKPFGEGTLLTLISFSNILIMQSKLNNIFIMVKGISKKLWIILLFERC